MTEVADNALRVNREGDNNRHQFSHCSRTAAGKSVETKTTEEEEGDERAEEEETVRARQHAKMGKYGVGHSRSDEMVGRPGKR